jgi:hypothetical protein
MPDILYNSGLDAWKDWTQVGFTWILVQSTYTPSRNHSLQSDLAPHELSVGGYSRKATTGNIRTVDATLNRIKYDCDNPTFGPLDLGQIVGYVVLARNDESSSSLLLVAYDVADYATDGSVLSPIVSPDGVHYTMQAP